MENTMSKIQVKILGTGAYLPPNPVSSSDLEKKLGFAPGTFEKTSGVRNRFHVQGETSSEMGAHAARKAIESSGLEPTQIDAIVSVSGVAQQAIPCTAALIHNQLKLASHTAAFDLNASCLSFLTGLEILGHLIAQGVYRRVLLVASDIASAGLNPKDPKTASLFGDGAAAVLLGPSENQGIIATHFEMKSEHVEDCQCQGGGTLRAPQELSYFRMNGPRLFKAVMPPLLKMVRTLTKEPVDLFIPHQASPMALDLFQKKLKIPDSRIIHIVREYGNMVATSLPFALHLAIQQKRLVRGNRTLLFGTGAGLTIGGVLLEY